MQLSLDNHDLKKVNIPHLTLYYAQCFGIVAISFATDFLLYLLTMKKIIQAKMKKLRTTYMVLIEQIYHGATETCLKIVENGDGELLKM